MIPADLEAKIKRLYFSEGWRVGTIAREVGVHHSVVRRAIGPTEETPPHQITKRPARIDPFLPFILEVLERHPRLRASRLYQMVCERGYVGSPDHFRHMVARHRPKPVAEAYLRTRSLPGEEAQVDWADFGPVRVGHATRRLSAYLMTLSWSRAIFLRFYLSQKTAWFLRGHAAAFAFFGGVSRVILYDNLKSAVLERVGDAIRFHEDLLGFATHHGYEPRPVALYRGNEKGRVERSVRYVRDSFFAALEWSDIDELNAKAAKWCVEVSLARR
ncbi:MAG TPA: IS21 family transposase, partial [Kiloniellales bacterium]|nr:IS21 family transposase [Kiloniellales bacterium]